MTDVSNGEKTRFPQPVDSAWGRAANPWGRRCGSLRAVAGQSTGRVCRSSTEVGKSPWKTGGRRGGRSSESSGGGPTVDSEAVNCAGLPPLIHRVTPHLTGPDGTYPQSPQHLRRRLVISSDKSKQPSGCGRGQPTRRLKAHLAQEFPGRSESKPSSQEASHEVPG